ncbi:MAG: hypothetical protein H9Q66_03945 [Spiroplasma ixodetis]|nr:hypothetical protein [Spiroplasma ixodetis]
MFKRFQTGSKNPQHFKLLNSYQISRTSVYQKIVLKSVAIPTLSVVNKNYLHNTVPNL